VCHPASFPGNQQEDQKSVPPGTGNLPQPFLALGTGFTEDNFSTDKGAQVGYSFGFATHLLCSAPVPNQSWTSTGPWPEGLMDGGTYVSEARSWSDIPPPAVQKAGGRGSSIWQQPS